MLQRMGTMARGNIDLTVDEARQLPPGERLDRIVWRYLTDSGKAEADERWAAHGPKPKFSRDPRKMQRVKRWLAQKFDHSPTVWLASNGKWVATADAIYAHSTESEPHVVAKFVAVLAAEGVGDE